MLHIDLKDSQNLFGILASFSLKKKKIKSKYGGVERFVTLCTVV